MKTVTSLPWNKALNKPIATATSMADRANTAPIQKCKHDRLSICCGTCSSDIAELRIVSREVPVLK